MRRVQFLKLRSARSAVWISSCYFWYFAAVGCLTPYIALYYRHLQFTGFQIGVLSAILPLGIALLATLSGSLADSFSAHRLLLRTTLVLAAFTALMLAQVTSFVALLLLMIVLSVSLAAVPTLLDSFAMVICDQEGVSFGRLRVWGTFGYIISVWLVARQMGQNISSFFLIAYGAALVLACISTLGLPSVPRPLRLNQRMWHGIAALVHDRSMILLLITVYLVTSNATILSSYFGIYLIEIGGTAQLVGTASALAAISEIPVMIFGRGLLERFTSRKMLVLAVGVYLSRFIFYGLPPAGSWVLLIQLLHGLSFGLYLMASVTLVHELAGRERAATAQGLLGSTSFGFGAITGSLVGGALLDRLGGVGIFRMAAGGMLLGLIVCLIAVRTATVAHGQPQPLLQPSHEDS